MRIDTRPLWILILSRSFRWLVFAALAGGFFFIVSSPTPEGLTPQGQRAIAVFVVCVVLWVTHVLPLMITSLLAIILLPLLGIMDSSKAYSLFGNQAIFFILGAFILAAAMMKSGLSTRITLLFLGKAGNSPKSLLLGILSTAAFLSFWMSEHAVAAMMFPIALEISRGLGLSPSRSRYGKALFMSLAWGAVVGGVATFLGGARAPLAIGILKENTGVTIGFFEWMIAILPVVIVMLFVAYFVITTFFKVDVDSIDKAKTILEEKIRAKGRISAEEKSIGIIMLLTIFGWIFFGKQFGLANIAIASVVLLFIFKLVKWKDIEDYVNWGIILMYGGAIALGYGLESTGAAQWAVKSLLANFDVTPLKIIMLLAIISLVLTEGISNAAVVAILLPAGISIASVYGIDVRAITYAVTVPAGLAFCLPMSTPSIAIAYSSGYIKMKDMIFAGAILGLTSWAVFILTAKFYWPLLGLRI